MTGDIIDRYMVDGKPWIKMEMSKWVDIKGNPTDEMVKKSHEYLSDFSNRYQGLIISDVRKPQQLITNYKGWQFIRFCLQGRAFEVLKYIRMREGLYKTVKGYKGGKRKVWKRRVKPREFPLDDEMWTFW